MGKRIYAYWVNAVVSLWFFKSFFLEKFVENNEKGGGLWK